MSQMVYLKETTTTTVETKVVEIPDYSEELKELREQGALQKIYSEVSQKRVEATASAPFEQIVIYLSELVKPFLNDQTIMDSSNYSARLRRSSHGFILTTEKRNGIEPYIVVEVSIYKEGIGWKTRLIGRLFKDGYEFLESQVPMDTHNIKTLLGKWKYFKKDYTQVIDSIAREKAHNIRYEKEKYDDVIDMIDNFIV